MKNLFRWLFFAIFLALVSCQRSVTYYDESRKPPIPPKHYRSTAPVRYDNFSQPSSGRYQNPYNRAPNRYYPYYDYDYYYVPPTGYNPYDRDNDIEFKGAKFDMNNLF